MRALYNISEVLAVKVSAAVGVTSGGPSISTAHLYFDNNPA